MGIRPEGDPGRAATPRRPVRVEVITYAPTIFTHCQHCEVAFGQTGVGDRIHREQARESLPDDLRAEFAAVADWVHGLLGRHGRRIDVRLIDAASLQGVWKSLRHGTRRYPAVVVEGQDRFVGVDLPLAEAEIERRVAARAG
jgi:aromatic ring hydroxylase